MRVIVGKTIFLSFGFEASKSSLGSTLSLVDGYIQTDVYSKPTDHHMYLLRNSAHPRHCTKAIPFGVATRIRRNGIALVQCLG